jgi:hypothetical protein
MSRNITFVINIWLETTAVIASSDAEVKECKIF